LQNRTNSFYFVKEWLGKQSIRCQIGDRDFQRVGFQANTSTNSKFSKIKWYFLNKSNEEIIKTAIEHSFRTYVLQNLVST
jgi:hypothetical protein